MDRFPLDRYSRSGATEEQVHAARTDYARLDDAGQLAEAQRIAGISDDDLARELGRFAAAGDPGEAARALLPVDGQPPAADPEPAVAGGYDPGEHTVAEVEDYVEDNPDSAAAILAAETAGKNRSTLVESLTRASTPA